MDDRHLMVALDADGSGADPWVVVTRPTVEYETFQERKS
jgi:microcompartment protein CcmK/EutM